MLLCDINDKEKVECFKEIFTKRLSEDEFYWILLESKVIPEGSEGRCKRRAYALCHAVKIDPYSPKIKVVNGGVVDFGESFESAQKAIYQLVDYCLVTHSQPMKIGPRDSIYYKENQFSLDVDIYTYHETEGFYDTNIHFFEGPYKRVGDVRKSIERYYSSFIDISSYDRCACNVPTVAQRELEFAQKKALAEEIEIQEKEIQKRFDEENKTLSKVMFILKFFLYPIPFVGLVFFFVDKIVRKRAGQIATRFPIVIILLVYSMIYIMVFNSFLKMIKKPEYDDYNDWTPPTETFDVDYISP